MKTIRNLTFGLFLAAGTMYASGQCCNGNACVCNEDERPRPTCGAPYPAVCDDVCDVNVRPADPEADPFRNMRISDVQRERAQKAIDKRNLALEKVRSKMELKIAKIHAKSAKKDLSNEAEEKKFTKQIDKARKDMEIKRARIYADFEHEIRNILTDSQYAQFRQNVGNAPVRRYVAKPKPGPAPQLMK
ncbi:MAG: hypothetical protein K2M03_05420 [Muribaculaceae bacterium]|nr:hypothetical protein [Muribaculaceae bacterium]